MRIVAMGLAGYLLVIVLVFCLPVFTQESEGNLELMMIIPGDKSLSEMPIVRILYKSESKLHWVRGEYKKDVRNIRGTHGEAAIKVERRSLSLWEMLPGRSITKPYKIILILGEDQEERLIEGLYMAERDDLVTEIFFSNP